MTPKLPRCKVPTVRKWIGNKVLIEGGELRSEYGRHKVTGCYRIPGTDFRVIRIATFGGGPPLLWLIRKTKRAKHWRYHRSYETHNVDAASEAATWAKVIRDARRLAAGSRS